MCVRLMAKASPGEAVKILDLIIYIRSMVRASPG
jgi:hypothetical protein